MTAGDALLIVAFWGIWLILLYFLFLSLGSLLYFMKTRSLMVKQILPEITGTEPFVSILVPAFNEALVIKNTIKSLCEQNYPKDSFEVIVINDGSMDETGEIIDSLKSDYPNLIRFDVPVGEGGKGKSRTLNVGMQAARGDMIAVFDADNTPEPNFLWLTVSALLEDPSLVAVNGKVRTRNSNASWLTRFINLEFMYFQWLYQGGRWYWFRLSTLMGTGYVMHRKSLDVLGGFDEDSLVDDTEMSLRIFQGNYRIRWVPYAVTWEQEPETLQSWFKQRSRWLQGNMSAIAKYTPMAFNQPYPLGLEILCFVFLYGIYAPALLTSHIVMLLSLLGLLPITIQGPFLYLWGSAFMIFMAHFILAIKIEEPRISNYLYAVIGYFTYAQLFLLVLAKACYALLIQRLSGSLIKWDKTTRTRE